MSIVYTDEKNSDRIVGFIDILGFKELVKDSTNDEKVYDILSDFAARNRRSSQKPKPDGSIDIFSSISSFSDHIVISMPYEKPFDLSVCITELMFEISFLYAKLLPLGILLRGGISIGKCFHKENIVYGPALLDAIDIEGKTACYPRVVLSSTFRQYDIDNAVLRDGNGLVFRDGDGMICIDYLRSLGVREGTEGTKIKTGKILALDIATLRSLILMKCEEFKDKTGILAKWLWLANYFNKTIPLWEERLGGLGKKLTEPLKPIII